MSHSGASQLDTGLLAQSTQQIADIKEGMENIAQELTAKTSNLVTNGKVAKLETEVAKKMVGQSNEIASINSKIASLEKAVSQHTTTLDDVLVKKVAKLWTEVVKKMVGQSNDVLVTEMNSTTKKIAEIEQSLQNIDKLSTELKHLVDKVTQVKNTSDSNNYMLLAVNHAVYLTQRHPLHNKFKQQFKCLSNSISRSEEVILKEHPDHFEKANRIFEPQNF